MTRLRVYGRDIAFMSWMRGNPRLDSRMARLAPTDIDVLVHQYPDRHSTNPKRRIDNLMIVETKSHAFGPVMGVEFTAQQDTYAVFNAFMREVCVRVSRKGRAIRTVDVGRVAGRRRRVRFWGVHMLAMSSDTPDVGKLWWDDRPEPITVTQLEELMRFERNPYTLERIDYRDHHVNETGKWPLFLTGEVA